MAKYKSEDVRNAEDTLEHTLNSGGTVLVVSCGGNAFSVEFITKSGELYHLTYSLAVVQGWSVRSKNGRNTVSVSGGNFSKSDYLFTRLMDSALISGDNRKDYRVVTL